MLAGNGAIKNYLEGVIPKGYFDFESVVENNKNVSYFFRSNP